jgi:hypothetical protein
VFDLLIIDGLLSRFTGCYFRAKLDSRAGLTGIDSDTRQNTPFFRADTALFSSSGGMVKPVDGEGLYQKMNTVNPGCGHMIRKSTTAG